MSNQKYFLNMENCNFIDFPKSGQTTFAKQIMNAYGDEVCLVGITTSNTIPVGKWVKVEINGIDYNYFAVAKITPSHKKPLIPKRIQMYWSFRKYKREIFSLGVKNIFIQAPEILFAIGDLPWKSLCINMPGIVNPLSNARYIGAKYLANLFDYFYMKYLKKAVIILASADQRTIEDFLSTRGKIFSHDEVIHFPTRVETDLFFPVDKSIARSKLNLINQNNPMFAVTGRLAKIKGWQLIIDAFKEVLNSLSDAKLYFVGDGEDRDKIEAYITSKQLTENVVLVGAVTREDVALWINATDVILIGSYVEGWSLSMLESVACGKPLVSTDISGAQDMITEGINGFICYDRDINTYAELMLKILKLDSLVVMKHALKITEKYALSHLKNELDELWKR